MKRNIATVAAFVCFITGWLLTGCTEAKGIPYSQINNGDGNQNLTAYTDTAEYPVSGYSRLLTLCYSLPEAVSDEVSSTSAFQVTAVLSQSSRSVSDVSAFDSVTSSSSDPAAVFYAGLRETENRLLTLPVVSRSVITGTVSEPAAVGDTRSFSVLTGDTYTTVSAQCAAVTEHTAFWVDSASDRQVTETSLSYLTAEFEKGIPVVHEKFGEESDFDGNGQIFVLISRLDEGIFGYFYSADKFTQADLDRTYSGFGFKSNEADIFYVNSLYFSDFETYRIDIAATLVHEMQHMVHFDCRKRNNLGTVASWLNEGLSMLCEYYCGYAEPHSEYIADAFRSAGISLIESPDTAAHYGYALLFLRYLQERFGDEIVGNIYGSAESGVLAVQEASGTDFNILFADFCEMILKTGRGVTTDSRYEIAAFNFDEGTDDYARNGFNLASIVDAESEKMDLRLFNQLTLNPMKTYAFFPVIWENRVVSSFRFSSRNAALIIGAFSE